MKLVLQLAFGFLLSCAIGAAAYRRGSLARSGVVGALIVGTAIFGFGGWPWGLVLITFFVTSSRLSHYKESLKARVAEEKFSKGNQRDLGQALANGGAGALLSLAAFVYPGPLALAAFAGAMATVNADTWATELGVLSKRPPRSVLTLRVAEVGTSGAISGAGTLAGFAGALLIGVALWGFGAIDHGLGWNTAPSGGVWLLPAAVIGGVGGSLIDSVLGATVQAIFWCPRCGKETERTLHPCGARTEPLRGLSWLGNDGVNFIASLGGALLGVGVARALGAL